MAHEQLKYDFIASNIGFCRGQEPNKHAGAKAEKI